MWILAPLLALAASAAPATPDDLDLPVVTVQSGGMARQGWVYAPKPTGKPRPLIILLCSRQGVKAMRAMTRRSFEEAARREDWVVAYPEPYGGMWNDGRAVDSFRSQKEGVDDGAFLAALTTRLAKDYRVDAGAVYAAGYSSGGMMALRLACQRSDLVAAAASVAGSLPLNVSKACRPERPVSVMVVLGTADPFLQYDRGVVHISMFDLGRILAPGPMMSLFAKNGGCAAERVSALPDTDKDDGSTVRRHRWGRCKEGSEALYYEVRGGGHTWPGGQTEWVETVGGKTNGDFDASEAAFDFFARHRRR